MRRRLLLLATALFVGQAGCSSDDGKPSGNTGSSGSSGTADSGAADSAAETSTGAKKKTAEPCAAPEECESNVCFLGGTQSYCSLKCTPTDAPTVCVAPLTGSCNKQGFCKRD